MLRRGGLRYRRAVHDADDTDPFAAFVDPTDPIDSATYDDHPGVATLRAGARLLEQGSGAEALATFAEARSGGVPAELAPHVAVLEGCASILRGDAAGAVGAIADAWRAHPDVAALPAVLGTAQLVTGDAKSAAHTMYAALVSDDPDRSLAVHRRRLTQLMQLVRSAR
ncbi:MAG: hypothetical protein JWM86_30 [Thermoleophilia bacterium]|nr:hypothetical protein [Thermoleophilia bacterium]